MHVAALPPESSVFVRRKTKRRVFVHGNARSPGTKDRALDNIVRQNTVFRQCARQLFNVSFKVENAFPRENTFAGKVIKQVRISGINFVPVAAVKQPCVRRFQRKSVRFPVKSKQVVLFVFLVRKHVRGAQHAFGLQHAVRVERYEIFRFFKAVEIEKSRKIFVATAIQKVCVVFNRSPFSFAPHKTIAAFHPFTDSRAKIRRQFFVQRGQYGNVAFVGFGLTFFKVD